MAKEITLQQSVAKNNQEIKIIHEVNDRAEKFYEDAVKIGDHAAHALGRSHRSQLTGLENVAESALKITDIFDYIKRQTARYSYWRIAFVSPSDREFGEWLRKKLVVVSDQLRSKPEKASELGAKLRMDLEEELDRKYSGSEKTFGERLRSYLENDLAKVRDEACAVLQIGDTSDEEKQLRRRVYLLLVRQFIGQMVIEYEYRVTSDGSGGKNGASGR
jgi:hypothetical protein